MFLDEAALYLNSLNFDLIIGEDSSNTRPKGIKWFHRTNVNNPSTYL